MVLAITSKVTASPRLTLVDLPFILHSINNAHEIAWQHYHMHSYGIQIYVGTVYAFIHTLYKGLLSTNVGCQGKLGTS